MEQQGDRVLISRECGHLTCRNQTAPLRVVEQGPWTQNPASSCRGKLVVTSQQGKSLSPSPRSQEAVSFSDPGGDIIVDSTFPKEVSPEVPTLVSPRDPFYYMCILFPLNGSRVLTEPIDQTALTNNWDFYLINTSKTYVRRA